MESSRSMSSWIARPISSAEYTDRLLLVTHQVLLTFRSLLMVK
uniref:Uncharacterized protein n=1 Tax=Brassica oleracea TaxID=3712 RepID=A0A3P6F076_BRAOL|nr:unnamed protein product [Brassica oleracea]